MRKPITPVGPVILRGRLRIPAKVTGRNVFIGLVYAQANGDGWSLVFDAETGEQVGGTDRFLKGGEQK